MDLVLKNRSKARNPRSNLVEAKQAWNKDLNVLITYTKVEKR